MYTCARRTSLCLNADMPPGKHARNLSHAHLALQQLQGCATSSRDMAHLVGQARLLHCCHRVSATDDSDCALSQQANKVASSEPVQERWYHRRCTRMMQ